jgi:hypothetical protein
MLDKSVIRAIANAVSLICIALLLSANASAQQGRITPHVVPERLGNPFAEQWPNDLYPRNVWDMQVFGGFLYIGAGNSSNLGPSPNAGPVPVIRYDGQRFERVFTVREEQIDTFRVLDGRLYVPGHDGRQGWDFGNLYTFDGRSWRGLRTIPNGVHLYDLYEYGGRLIVAGAAHNQGFDVWVSHHDEEGPWRVAGFEPNSQLTREINPSIEFWRHGDGRIYSLFELGGRLYGSGRELLGYPPHQHEGFVFATVFRLDDADRFTPVAAVTGRLTAAGLVTAATDGADLFPGASRLLHNEFALLQVRRAVTIDGQTFYVGALPHNDHHWRPVAVFAASTLDNARMLATPSGVQVYDLLARQGDLYALGNVRTGPHSYEVQLLKLQADGAGFDALVGFEAPTFARSFEFYRGYWYFGLGSEVSSEDARLTRAQAVRVDWSARLSPETGAIWRMSDVLAEPRQGAGDQMGQVDAPRDVRQGGG